MKKCLIVIVVLMNSVFCFADNLTVAKDSALQYYMNSDFEQALSIYEDLYSKNYSAPELFYNMANCYYNVGDIANAIYFYEKALVLNPNDEDIKHNLKIANTKLKNKLEALPEVFYKRWFNGFVNSFSSDAWTIISILTFLLSLVLSGVYLFSKRIFLRKIGFYSAISFIIISIISLIMSIHQAKKITSSQYAVVFETSLVKSSPADDSNNLFEINEGLKVQLLDSLNNWYNIKLADGKQGWVPSENIKVI